ncbi:MAG: hypothetical protein QW101_04405, partial [Ignisphaera sp.]
VAIVIQREHTDTVYYVHNFVEDKVLCNNSKNKESIISKISLPTPEIEAAYLILSITRSVNIDVMKWKIALNNVILTREFKPHIEKTVNEDYTQAVFVYDVSKIVNSNDVLLRILCNAKGYIYLDGATLVALLRYKGFHIHMYCEVDPYTLVNPVQKPLTIVPSFKANEILLNMGVTSPSNSLLNVATYGGEKKIKLFKGYNVFEVKLDRNDVTAFRIISDNENLRHIFSCTIFRYSEFPKIVVEDLRIEKSAIKFRLTNVGNSRSDKLELLIIRHGIPIYRVSLKSLEPQEHLDYEIGIESIKQANVKTNGVVLRIVWSKAYQLFEQDIPIKIKE